MTSIPKRENTDRFFNEGNWASSWENLFLSCANKKGTDQPAHPRCLISAFVVHCLDSIIQATPAMSTSRILILSLMSKWFFIPNVFLYISLHFNSVCVENGKHEAMGISRWFFMPWTYFLLHLLLPVSKSKIGPRKGAVLSALALYMHYLKCKNLPNNGPKQSVKTSFDWAINPLFSAIKSIHCFDMKSHSVP